MNIKFVLLMREKRGPGTKEPSPKRLHNTMLSPQNAGGKALNKPQKKVVEDSPRNPGTRESGSKILKRPEA